MTTAVPAPAQAAVASPFTGRALLVVPDQASDAARAMPALAPIAAQPQALWVTGRPGPALFSAGEAAVRQHRVLVAVVYALPQRDCGSWSAGGLDPAGYRALIGRLAGPLGRARAAVVLEPDGLADLDCLTAGQRSTRLALLRGAVAALTRAGSAVYLDAGHAGWVPAEVMAQRLRSAGVAGARGVSLNVSNYDRTSTEISYGRALASRLPGLHAVIDTSRNGLGPTADAQWCNAPGRALGSAPHATHDAFVDALLWVKAPGESDGPCGRGEPAAGTFWTGYALGLLQRSALR